MSPHAHINRPVAIAPDATRRDAASDQIKHFIRSHQLTPGAKMPTVRKLSEHFALTRDSVWRALKQLQQEQWLEVLPNKRYTVSQMLYTRILRAIRVRALFSGKGYIYFSGFRRLADALSRECRYHNIHLHIDLLPLHKQPAPTVWENCDLLMIDSDSSGPLLGAFESFPVPVIGMDADYSDRYHANIVTDHHLGGRICADAMLKKGAREAVVVYHAGSEGNPRVAARIEGFRQCWLEAGRSRDSLCLVPIEWSQSSFQIALNIQAHLQKHPARGSYFATDGRLATNLLEVLAYQNVAVPGEAGVIGYDGAQRGELTDPPMTTIQQDMDRIAHTAVHWIRQIASGHAQTGVLERIPPVMITRDSY